MGKIHVLLLGLSLSGSFGTSGCDRLLPSSKPKAENPQQSSLRPLEAADQGGRDVPRILSIKRIEESTGEFQIIVVDAKTGDATKTLVLRLDSTNGTTWKLDPNFSKWVLIEGSNSSDIRDKTKDRTTDAAAITPSARPPAKNPKAGEVIERDDKN